MGNFNSKSLKKDMDSLFGREKWKEHRREEKRKKAMNPNLKRTGLKDAPLVGSSDALGGGGSSPKIAPPTPRSYDEEALERMRIQLHTDSDAFLLNNILLSVQFFENYEREAYHIKSVPINEREHKMDEAMVMHHKHVFFADRLQECVQEHVRYSRHKGRLEPIATPRLFVIYDNVEASEPGDTSDYSAVLDAPFYKLQVENCKESGYVKLKKLEVLESALVNKDNDLSETHRSTPSDQTTYTDSERESDDSDEFPYEGSRGEALLEKIKARLKEPAPSPFAKVEKALAEENSSERRSSGPIKIIKPMAARGNISNVTRLRKTNTPLKEDQEKRPVTEPSSPLPDNNNDIKNHYESRPRKSNLKSSNGIRRLSGPTKERNQKIQFSIEKNVSNNTFAEDTETSGYRSTSSSKLNESSETESDYGYSTITDLSTPKPVEVTVQSNVFSSSGVLPEECWSAVQVKSTTQWNDDEDEDDEELSDAESRDSTLRTLYETNYYLSSTSFMTNFVDNFVIKLGACLGLSTNAINSALTQGAAIYCDSMRNGVNIGQEVIPAVIASWPNVANQWIIRERRIIQNPRTNFSYQWPTKYMVSKTMDFGCLLIPVGFRQKRGNNSERQLQWRIIFPAAERYLESRLAHSHIRCYLFTLALHKTYMESEMAKIGVDVSHIKNHLFWQCEDNYAKWPEDRLGETLRLFLRSFYSHFSQARFPNYFVETCNDFKGIPKPLLLKIQRRLADILEAPVMHVLGAVQKLKYTNKDFYPRFDYYQLYQILTCRNPLRILNPSLPPTMPNNDLGSDSDNEYKESSFGFWDQGKDKQYQWKKAKHRQSQEVQRRKAAAQAKKVKSVAVAEKTIDRNVILPKKMEPERRRLVLEFFIPHFIAMARCSDKFEATKQAIIYLEQAHRLCMLLLEEPAGETVANDLLDTIREGLAEYQRKLVHQGGYKLMNKRESRQLHEFKRGIPTHLIRRQRQRASNQSNTVEQDTSTDKPGVSAFTFVDVHPEPSGSGINNEKSIKLTDNGASDSDEESKL